MPWSIVNNEDSAPLRESLFEKIDGIQILSHLKPGNAKPFKCEKTWQTHNEQLEKGWESAHHEE